MVTGCNTSPPSYHPHTLSRCSNVVLKLLSPPCVHICCLCARRCTTMLYQGQKSRPQVRHAEAQVMAWHVRENWLRIAARLLSRRSAKWKWRMIISSAAVLSNHGWSPWQSVLRTSAQASRELWQFLQHGPSYLRPPSKSFIIPEHQVLWKHFLMFMKNLDSST